MFLYEIVHAGNPYGLLIKVQNQEIGSILIEVNKCDHAQMVKGQGSGYLDISQLLLLLPVPDRQDVVVGIVHSAEEGAAVLREKQGVRSS